METINESIYDHPKYYDLVFGADCAAEMHFIRDVNDEFLGGKARRLFEPACGTGRLLYGLAKHDFAVEGIDLNDKAIDYCNERFRRADMPETAWVADMSDFKSRKKFDLAFNTINSFRHLMTGAAAEGHLRSMAAGAHKGAIYLLGIHLTPTEEPPSDSESWSARRGHLAVTTDMWTIERLPKKRLERFGIAFDIYTPTRQWRIEDELRLRSYTPRQMEDLVLGEGSWEIIETFDFAYDIDSPATVDASTEDVVYVLRRLG